MKREASDFFTARYSCASCGVSTEDTKMQFSAFAKAADAASNDSETTLQQTRVKA